ncbi:EAL domain-containing protein [Ideonella sp.]|uniref:EAL domain-containing protein n=1 Tax=Ideonella sp. TaxID=1929293 RepID=UPI0035B13F30
MSFAPWAGSQELLASAILAAAVISLVLHVSVRLANQALSQHDRALHLSGPPVHVRVRTAMYIILAVAGCYAGVQAWNAVQWQRAQHTESRITEALGLQRSAGQDLVRLAALVGHRGADRQAVDELAAVLREEAARSLALQKELDSTVWYRQELAQQVADHRAQWRHEWARLSIAAQEVLHLTVMGGDSPVPERVTQVLQAAGPALTATDGLAALVHRATEQRLQQHAHLIKLSSFTVMLVLLGVAFIIIEPTTQTLREQYRRLRGQSRELARLAMVANRTESAVALTDRAGQVDWVNDAYRRIISADDAPAVGVSLACALVRHGAPPAEVDALLERARRHPHGAQALWHLQNGAHERWVEVDVRTLDPDGRDAGLVMMARDVTERRRADARQRIAAIAFDSLEAVVITDATQRILQVNPAFCRITGFSQEEAVGSTTAALLKSGRHGPEFYQAMWAALQQERRWQGEIWNRRKGGEVYPEWLSITAVMDEQGTLTNYVAVFSDITEKKRADETIHNLAFYDALTGLPNRRLLMDRLTQSIHAGRRHGMCAALLFIDLDKFKALNDLKGHEMGDRLLKEIARRLQACVRASDTVARQGGDEFVVLLNDLSGDAAHAAMDAETVAEKIRDTVEVPVGLEGFEWRVTASIGVSLLTGEATQTVDDLLKRADLAMYEAKRAGRNAIRFFDPARQAEVEAHVQLAADLRHAVAHDELRLHYQPQFDTSGAMVGAEALVRWAHQGEGLVPPAAFIHVAEESDLIVQIGDWVLDRACRDLAAWQSGAGAAPFSVAVNVSARQFQRDDFVDGVCGALRRAGAQAHGLVLELTESTLLTRVDEVIGKMQALRAMGVRMAIDDFGTGHSSLSYLSRLPVDYLKIDRAFVHQMHTQRSDAVIIRTIIGMARSLGLGVIAEGVETPAQKVALEAYGCDALQGYLFARPGPAEHIGRRLRGEQLVDA